MLCSILYFPVLCLKGEPDHPQNLINCSLHYCRCRAILKIHQNPLGTFWVMLLTDKQTNKLEKHSESADLRQGRSLPPYSFVRNAAFSRSKVFGYNSCSRTAWSRDPALRCSIYMSMNITWLICSYSSSLWRPLITPDMALSQIQHFSFSCIASEGWARSLPKFN